MILWLIILSIWIRKIIAPIMILWCNIGHLNAMEFLEINKQKKFRYSFKWSVGWEYFAFVKPNIEIRN